jgi:beta-fructofuranosidase
MATPGTRPKVHFTAESGWINDPHGVVWHDGAYHVFFQYVPGSTRWGPQCLWGHAISADLVHWREVEPALTPVDGEIGCWSGASVVTGDELQLLYTRVAGDHLGRGVIARARPDAALRRWRADPVAALVEPPADLDVEHFRDPCVFRHDGRWVMVVGVGLADGTAAVVQYTSTDLVQWDYTGVLCQRSRTEIDPVWTGSMWECPQLFPLGEVWVLVVSVWADDVLHDVVAATGEYDGERFTPMRWQTLTRGDSAYAMTSFGDRAGRRCVVSWLREAASFDPSGSVRAGAHSLPYVMSLGEGGGLTLALHPDVDRQLGPPVAAGEAVAATAFEITLTDAEARAEVVLRDGQVDVFRVELAPDHRMVVDADIVEVLTGDAVLATRIRRSGGPIRVLAPDAVQARVRALG